MPELDICHNCFQRDRCGAKGTIGPRTHEQLVHNSSMEPRSPIDCWFYTCREGHMEARHALRNARSSHQTGLIQFFSNHKPFIELPNLSGRFVVSGNSVDGYQDGAIVIRHYTSIIPLTDINHIPK